MESLFRYNENLSCKAEKANHDQGKYTLLAHLDHNFAFAYES